MYEEAITRAKPGCIVFLLDRSDSMGRDWGSNESLAEGAARVVNSILLELCIRARKGPGVTYHYFDVGIFGYGLRPFDGGQGVESAFGGTLKQQMLVPLPDLATNPLGVHEAPSQDLGGLPVQAPYWVEPVHGGMTPMCEAVAIAGQQVFDWVQAHPESFPPIVFNITDGWVTDSPFDGATLEEWAARLTGLSTQDGPALLFNVYLSPDSGTPRLFPDTPNGLPDPGPSLFDISSELPPNMLDNARTDNVQVSDRSRGFAFNVDARTLLKVLEIGTRVETKP
jgi:hypothetical protein